MASAMDTMICPKGHQSSDADYCSECGAKIDGATASETGDGAGGNGSRASAAEAQVCPDCGTAREHKGVVFCEICGYNFATGARGEFPIDLSAVETAMAPRVEAEVLPGKPTAAGAEWSVVVSVDASSKAPDSPEPPSDLPTFTVELSKPVNLIGRTSQTRAIFPEIAIDHDDAVSHRHALLQFDQNGNLVVRDIGAANGTSVNGTEIVAMSDHPLHDGDVITLGHWSSVRVKARV